MNSISFKVLMAFVIGMVMSVSLITLVLISAWVFKNNIYSELEAIDASQELADALSFNAVGIPEKIEFDDDYNWLFESLSQELAYRVIDQSGKVIMYSAAGPSFWSSIDIPDNLSAGSFEFQRDGILFDGATGIVKNEGQNWFTQIAVSRRFIYFAHDAFGLAFLEAGLLVLSVVLFLVFGGCAHFTLRHTLRPLRELSDSASAISPRSLQARLQNDNIPTEIAPLVNSFNQALDRLEHGYRLQQVFLSTAAHELKTPLSLIRAQLELMPETDERNWLLHDVEYMSHQVQQLLLLAEASEPQNYKFITVDLEKEVVDAVTYMERMAETANVKLNLVFYSDDITLRADKGALFTLLKNLLENAIQHAPPGGQVWVDVFSDKMGVWDWGQGIDEAELPRLFDRFWRGEHRLDIGAGLGLTICREIALAHGWLLTAHRMEPGLMFQLMFNAGNEVKT
ncbi:ATP-binding protein [Methylophaga sp.]|uniref:sensor histidine kinase n=1 Tax=Methylophaga sp. TaxID=2024840 RepID=UPI0025DE0333|nr:ATP-binding protein [Methylophaga sp.]